MHGARIASADRGTRWRDHYWTSRDGLRLYCRDYAGTDSRPPLLMLHGLTRNSRDFEKLAARYAGEWRVLAVDFRGRGMSQWDPIPARYLPQTYAMDVLELLDALGLDTAVFIGTSLGGLVTMAVAAVQPQRIAAALLNDVGPELGAAGFERIRTYAGKPAVFRDWDDAVDLFRARHRNMHPTYGPAEWLAFAKRLCRETESGIEFDYDMAIAEPLNEAGAGVVADAWPFYRALAGRPVLVLRGEHSDLLPIEVVERMSREIPDVDVVTIPGVGHAPDLDEPQAVEAIDRLLLRTLATRRA